MTRRIGFGGEPASTATAPAHGILLHQANAAEWHKLKYCVFVRIAAIVEGHGEVQAVPILLRRVAAIIDPVLDLEALPPLRVPASTLRRSGEIERSVELAARKLGGRGGIVELAPPELQLSSCQPSDTG